MSQSHQNPSKQRESKLASHVNTLMVHYCLELQNLSAQAWIDRWLVSYPIQWVTLAVIEALYLGRYKAISVEQILVNWQRRGQACHHFTHEFERVISCRFPRIFRDFKRHPAKLDTNSPVSSPNTAPAIQTAPDAVLPASPAFSHRALKVPVATASLDTYLQEAPLQPLQNRPEPLETGLPVSPDGAAPMDESIQNSDIQDANMGFTPFIRWRALPENHPWTTDLDLDSTPVLEEAPILQFVPNFVPDLAQTALFEKLKAISAVSTASQSSNWEQKVESPVGNGSLNPFAWLPDPWAIS